MDVVTYGNTYVFQLKKKKKKLFVLKTFDKANTIQTMM